MLEELDAFAERAESAGLAPFDGLYEAADRILSAPLALLGDHVLLRLERTGVDAPGL